MKTDLKVYFLGLVSSRKNIQPSVTVKKDHHRLTMQAHPTQTMINLHYRSLFRLVLNVPPTLFVKSASKPFSY